MTAGGPKFKIEKLYVTLHVRPFCCCVRELGRALLGQIGRYNGG